MNVNSEKVLSLALTVLLVTAALPFGIVGLSDTASADPGDWYTLRQGSTCREVNAFDASHPKMQPHVEVIEHTEEMGPTKASDWDGPETISSIMDYRYRYDPNQEEEPVNEDTGQKEEIRPYPRGQTDRYAPYLDSNYQHEPWSYGTYGLYNWSDNGDSHMFFYQNPSGEVSLVIRHDRMYDTTGIGSHAPYNGRYTTDNPDDGFHEPSPGGGSATFEFRNLPRGEWAYIDDMYPDDDMDDLYVDGDGVRYGHAEAEYEAEPLREFGGGYFQIDWSWGSGGTDGGAYRGFHRLSSGEEVVITPRFSSSIDAWEVRSNEGSDRLDGTLKGLEMGEPLTITRGRNCPDVSVSLSANKNTVEAGESVTFDAQGNAARYEWDFDGDGRTDRTTQRSNVTHTFTSPTPNASREVTVTAYAGGASRSDSTTVEVLEHQNPRANMNVQPGEQGLSEYNVVGEQLTFNGSQSWDNRGISQYVWDFGDGDTATGRVVTHSFDSTGRFNVTLTVTGGAGNTDQINSLVTVNETDTTPPNATAEAAPSEIEAGGEVTFGATESTDNRQITGYTWSLGDGTQRSGSEFSHTYSSAGNYTATLTARDAAGNEGTDQVRVRVLRSRNPNVTDLTVPSEIVVGRAASLQVDATDNGDIASYEWYVDGDDSPDATGASTMYTVERSIDQPRDITVRVVVTDTAGNTRTQTETVTLLPVDDDPPTVRLSADPERLLTGNSVTFNASRSTDEPHDAISEYRWDFDGDNETDATTKIPTVSHQYPDAGTFNATVTVVDENGNAATKRVRIVVNERSASEDDGGGGAVNLGPPPVVTDVKRLDANRTAVDVRNGRGDESITASLPRSNASAATGVRFQRLAVDIADSDAHVVFQTAASADAPESIPAVDAPERSLAYFDLGAKYLDAEIENATVTLTVQKSELGKRFVADDVSVFRYDGSWERLNATVVGESADAYRLKVTADGLGTVAVGATPSLTKTDARLAATTVTRGEPVKGIVTVENTADQPRNVTVALTLDGTAVAEKTATVPANRTTNVTLSTNAGEPGTYEVAVGGLSAGTLTVEAKQTQQTETPAPADVSVADVSLNASTISAGQEVEVTATVENDGGRSATHEVTLTLFGETLATKTVTVPADETKTVTFVREVAAAGSYTVKVNGETATLDVTGATERTTGTKTPSTGVPGFGVATALVALLAAALLARLRD